MSAGDVLPVKNENIQILLLRQNKIYNIKNHNMYFILGFYTFHLLSIIFQSYQLLELKGSVAELLCVQFLRKLNY